MTVVFNDAYMIYSAQISLEKNMLLIEVFLDRRIPQSGAHSFPRLYWVENYKKNTFTCI